MLRTRSAVVALVLWTVAVTWLVVQPEEVRAQRLLLALAIAATTTAAIDRHASQFREVVQLTLRAASFGQNSRVPAQDAHADDGERGRG
jgi:hypothetical protein